MSVPCGLLLYDCVACGLLRADAAVGDGVAMVGLLYQCLDNPARVGYGCGSAMIDVSQVGSLVYCCQCLLMEMTMVVALYDQCCCRCLVTLRTMDNAKNNERRC